MAFRLSAVATAVLVAVALLAVPARAQLLFLVDEHYTSETACNQVAIPYLLTAIQTEEGECVPVSCAPVGGGIYHTVSCITAYSFPQPSIDPSSSYIFEVVLSGEGCAGAQLMANAYRVNQGCVPLDDATGGYFEAIVAGSILTLKLGCDATCSPGDCSDFFIVPVTSLDSTCFTRSDGNSSVADFLALLPCAAHGYTLPHTGFLPTKVDAVAISPTRDCWAQGAGGTVYGGWKVTAVGEDYCCVVRGMYSEDTSLTGCGFDLPNPSDYFYDASNLTYQQCYSGLDEEDCLTTPTWGNAEVTIPIACGAVVGDELGGLPVTRSYAVRVDDTTQGAYLLTVDLSFDYYCTGRGVVAGDLCVVNGCGVTTPDYITVGPAAEGVFCYHTCYNHHLGP